MLARHSIALAVVVASAILSACASDKPEQRAEPPPPPIRPVAHSSVHAVLLHHSELALTDALRRVLASPEIAEAMGRRAHERIERWGFEQDIAGLRHALQQVSPGFET